MTSRRLEQLNRAWRIRQLLESGVPHPEIAAAEHIGVRRVRAIAHRYKWEKEQSVRK